MIIYLIKHCKKIANFTIYSYVNYILVIDIVYPLTYMALNCPKVMNLSVNGNCLKHSWWYRHQPTVTCKVKTVLKCCTGLKYYIIVNRIINKPNKTTAKRKRRIRHRHKIAYWFFFTKKMVKLSNNSNTFIPVPFYMLIPVHYCHIVMIHILPVWTLVNITLYFINIYIFFLSKCLFDGGL